MALVSTCVIAEVLAKGFPLPELKHVALNHPKIHFSEVSHFFNLASLILSLPLLIGFVYVQVLVTHCTLLRFLV